MLIRGGYMKKSVNKNNKGYSLVELVIVIAIIAILAAMALVSVTIIHSARAKDSALKLDSMVAEVITKSKNMNPNETDPNGNKYDGYAIAVYKNNSKDKFIIAPLYYSEAGGIAGSGHYSPIYNIDNPSSNGCKETIIQVPSSVSVTFKGTTLTNSDPQVANTDYASDDTAPKSGGNEWVFIRFDKKGNCISGYGEYKFYKRNGNVVSRVIIRQNGSHEVK